MKGQTSSCSPYLCYQAADTEHLEENFCGSNMSKINQNEQHITMLVYKMECFRNSITHLRAKCMFGTVANGSLPGRKYKCSPLKL